MNLAIFGRVCIHPLEPEPPSRAEQSNNDRYLIWKQRFDRLNDLLAASSIAEYEMYPRGLG